LAEKSNRNHDAEQGSSGHSHVLNAAVKLRKEFPNKWGRAKRAVADG
jgi:hypothetical protein